MADVRIALIGAGSAIFSLTLIRDIALTKGLSGCTLCLMDIDKKRLDAVASLAAKYAQKVGFLIRVERTPERAKAMKDADFVVNTALAGGHFEQETMRRVGEKHGYYRGLDSVDFNMVSDYFTIQGYKQIRLIADIAEDAREFAPGAWFMQVANPMLEGCTLIQRKVRHRKFAGFCDGPIDVYELIQTLGLNTGDTRFKMAGMNHTIFLTELRNEGRDAYPLIDEWIKSEGPRHWESFSSDMDFQMSRAAADQYKVYGTYPIGDTVRSGGWKYHYDLETKRYWYGQNGGFDSEIGWRSYLKRVEKRTRLVFSLARKNPDQILSGLPPLLSEDPIVPFIAAVATGESRRLFINVPNDGIIDDLGNDVVVEVPCVVDRRGIHSERIGGLPKRLMDSVMLPRKLRMEWVLDAFSSGSRDALLEIITRDRRTSSERQAREVLGDILSLPFNAPMRKHYT
jgi:alpha-galactosidase